MLGSYSLGLCTSVCSPGARVPRIKSKTREAPQLLALSGWDWKT